ncbi:hypothetical protein QW180_19900 [Vibrio sinaloensis]|nr:hypothetical protein [Vibrio sinaloensis]
MCSQDNELKSDREIILDNGWQQGSTIKFDDVKEHIVASSIEGGLDGIKSQAPS